jgi:hypothetical protein
MRLINEIMVSCSAQMHPYLPQIAAALVATLLVVYGSSINALVKRWVGGMHFIIRLLVFVALCSFGYGFLALILSRLFLNMFQKINSFYLAMVVVVIFIIVGVLAEKKNQI